MIHNMKLREHPFGRIRDGYKTFELRLYDEKRRAISIGDTIVFTNLSSVEQTLAVKVIGLHRFASFFELYRTLPLEKCGYLPHEVKEASCKDMEQYYSAEEQKLYGVLAIEMELLSPRA